MLSIISFICFITKCVLEFRKTKKIFQIFGCLAGYLMETSVNDYRPACAPSCDSIVRLERPRQPGNMPHIQTKSGPSRIEGTLVKEELKVAIQNRRANQGLDVLQLPIKTEKNTSYQLSAEEQMKIIRRRERNKVAASRCREKKKQRLDELQMEADGLQDANNKLAQEIAKLRSEVNSLATNLRTHKCELSVAKVSDSKESKVLNIL